ncbi:MAG: 2-hydroxyacyl-CoA dehydratase [Deltaproteobacteria bacterium]|nr:2-hydroxyacyl-CoA dehydratase [Deltaproteobacteria bacterium]
MILRRLRYEIVSRLVAPALLRITKRRRSQGGTGATSPLGPPLESRHKLKELMSAHYLGGRFADGAVPVAYVTSGFPVELLRPFGYHVVYPENHGALCSARRLVPQLSEVAERAGFSRDLCGYARADLGSLLSGSTPTGRLPRPDLLGCCTNICQTVLYWYRVLADRLGVPLVLIDTPFVYGQAPRAHLDYVAAQLYEAYATAARVAKRRADISDLEVPIRLAAEGTQLWGECLGLSSHRPAPWTCFDGFVHMAPIVAMRGTVACNAYYRMLRDELSDRVARGIGGIEHERHRLLWDNLPIWYQIRELATSLAAAGFNFVCATYTDAWAEPGTTFDPHHPLESLAMAYSHVLLNQDLKNRLRVMTELARRFQVDGAVLHSDRSCKPYSVGQIDLKERLQRDLGIKTLILDADHADPRAFAAAQVESRLAAFMESFR